MSRFCRPLLLLACALAASAGRLGGVADLLRNFEAVDPDVLDVLTFERAGRPARRRVDAAAAFEMDIGDLDTSDILHCFSSLSYACFQRKIIVYLDSLNRVDKVNLFGGYVSFVRVAPAASVPITEQLLASRRITDQSSLAALLKDLYDDFFDSHRLRITVPGIDARLDARSARARCYDFAMADAKDADDDKEDATSAGPSDARNEGNDSTCYKGDQSMVAMSSALVLKMLMVLPTLLKIIAAKAIFGLVMGVMSVIISKMAILPILLSYAKKSNVGYTTTSSYKQGASPISFSPTTDNYRLYYRPDHPGRPTIAVRPTDITTTAGLSGFSAMPVPIRDNSWPESTFPSKSVDYAVGDLKYAAARTDMNRRRSTELAAISKPKGSEFVSGYAQTSANGRNVVATSTTAKMNAEATYHLAEENNEQAEVPIRAKR